METGARAPEQTAPIAGPRRLADALGRSGLGRLVRGAAENLRDPAKAAIVVLVLGLVLRALWLNVPAKGLIFDEAYYVNAARVILGWQAGAHYADSPAGLDPNTEHPPLGKLAMAASMSVFGDNGLGWRLPSLVAGIVALLAILQILRAARASPWLAVLVLVLVSLENLTFVHGRIGTLDMLVLAPMLVGSWLALERRWILAGIAMGLALLVKLTALYGIAAVLLYVLLAEGPRWWRSRRLSLPDVAGPASFVAVTLFVALGGLALMDARWTAYASPFDHIARMVSYGANLRAPDTAGICPGVDSKPWQWLFNECQITYLRTDMTVRAGDQVLARVVAIDFRGAFNPLFAAAIPLAGIFGAWYAWRTREPIAVWAVAWALANYVPYLLLAIFTPRIFYLYYALPLVPALAIAIALLLTRAGLPRAVRWAFVAAYVVGFAAYFPFRQIPT